MGHALASTIASLGPAGGLDGPGLTRIALRVGARDPGPILAEEPEPMTIPLPGQPVELLILLEQRHSGSGRFPAVVARLPVPRGAMGRVSGTLGRPGG